MKKFIGVILAIVAFTLFAVGCQRAERPGKDATYEITITNQSSWEGATHLNFYDFNGVVKGTADIQSGKASVTLKKGNYFAQISGVPETVSYNLPVLSSTETAGEIILTDVQADSSASYFNVLGVITKNGLPLKNYCAILGNGGETLDPENTDKNGVVRIGVRTGDYHVTVYSHSDSYTTYEFDVSVTSATRFFLAELTQADKVTHDEPIDPGRGDEEDPDVTDPDNPDVTDPDNPDPDNPDVTDPDNPDPDDPDVTDPDNPDPDNPDVTDPDNPDPDDPDVTDPDPDYPEPDPDDMYTKRPDPNNPPKSNLYKGKMTFWVMVNRLNGYRIIHTPKIKITNAETGNVEYEGNVPPVAAPDVPNSALEFNMLEIKLSIAKHYVNILSITDGYDFDPKHNYEMDENNYVLDIRVASHLTDKPLGHSGEGDVLPDLTFKTLNAGEKKLSEILTVSKMAVFYFYAGVNDSTLNADVSIIEETFSNYGDEVAFIFFTTTNSSDLSIKFQDKYKFTGKYYLVQDVGYNYKNNLIYNGGNKLDNRPLIMMVDSGGVYYDLFIYSVNRGDGATKTFKKDLELNRFTTPPKGSSDPVVNPTTPVVVPTSFVSFQGILPERRNLLALAA